RLKHGPLHACYVPEPWIVEWTTNELDKKANHVISQGCIVNNARKQKKKKKKQTPSETVNEKGRSKRPRKDADQSPSIQRRTTSQPSYKDSDKGCDAPRRMFMFFVGLLGVHFSGVVDVHFSRALDVFNSFESPTVWQGRQWKKSAAQGLRPVATYQEPGKTSA
ncbi:hypothetical protein HN51_035101, partial [Arachis hypogaea]